MWPITDDNREKVVFVAFNLALAAIWLRFLIRMISRWDVLATNVRNGIGLFMILFSLLWIVLVREKRSPISILMAGGVFVAVGEIARTFM